MNVNVWMDLAAKIVMMKLVNVFQILVIATLGVLIRYVIIVSNYYTLIDFDRLMKCIQSMSFKNTLVRHFTNYFIYIGVEISIVFLSRFPIYKGFYDPNPVD